MPRKTLTFLAVLLFVAGRAQKVVLTYPFEFEKGFLARGDYDTYFLDDPGDSTFSLILKDNRKVEYLWLDRNFKVIASVPAAIGNTLPGQTHQYIGGTAKDGEYHFIYHMKSGYSMETVDFNAKTVSDQKLPELPGSEKELVSFDDHNVFYLVAADDEASQLVLHIVTASGHILQKNIPFTVPADAGEQTGQLSEYLKGMQVIKEDQDPELQVAIQSVKLFSQPNALSIVVSGGHPIFVFTIGIPDLAVKQTTIDYSPPFSSEEGKELHISTYLLDDLLFSLLLNKKDIRITIHDLSSGKLLKKYVFTDESGAGLLAEYPITEQRRGVNVTKEIQDFKKLIQAFTGGTAGLMVVRAEGNKLVLTAGTYDLLPLPSGNITSTVAGGHQSAIPLDINTGSPVVYNPRYYTTTYFRMLLDGTTLDLARGHAPRPVTDQIRDYIDETGKRKKAGNQFAIGKNRYYGFYDRDRLVYVVRQIKLY